jgi:uncharacterized protein YycO
VEVKLTKNIILITLQFITLLCFANTAQAWLFQTGDIIFHQSKSSQSIPIQKATNSKYSHMGMIVNKNGKSWVLEAIQPVKYTPLDQWIERGEKRHFVVKRYKNTLSYNQKIALVKQAEKYLGKPYDVYFEWNDNAIYCSEIVWKSYKNALNIELGDLQQLKHFDLESTEVKSLMKQRYGTTIPLTETVIAPSAVFNSKLLITIHE